jgi:two-component system LytT family response regulator
MPMVVVVIVLPPMIMVAPMAVVVVLAGNTQAIAWGNSRHHARRRNLSCGQFSRVFLFAPFSREGVHRAIERVRRELLRLRVSCLVQGVTGFEQAPARRQPERLAVRSEGRIVFVDVDEIDWIAAAANYVQINAGRESYIMREGIGRLSERLDRQRFLRIHRSIIANVRKIRELHHCDYGAYIVVLRSGKELSCGHSLRNGLDRFVSECT